MATVEPAAKPTDQETRTQLPSNRRRRDVRRAPDGPSSGNPKRPALCIIGEALELPQPVFGMYPQALIGHVLPYLRCERRRIVHVCSGGLPPGEGIRVDVRPDARPDVLADGRALPFADGSVEAVMLDPPYTEDYAKNLYGVEYPRPAHLLAEAARVVKPGGRIAFVHFLVPNPPPGCRLVKVLGLSTGCGYQIRAVTIYEREQASLPLAKDD